MNHNGMGLHPADELQLTGVTPGWYAAGFAKFSYGSRKVRSLSRPATDQIVGRRFSDIIPTGNTKGITKYQVLKRAAKSFI